MLAVHAVLGLVEVVLVLDAGIREVDVGCARSSSVVVSGGATTMGGAERAALTPAAIECHTCSGPISSRKPDRVSTSRTLPKTRTR